MRINKYIAENTNLSRRKADEYIKTGKVFLNGKIIKELGIQIDPEKDIIKINEKKISKSNNKIYLALNKPRGYITTRHDEFGRKTVMSLVPEISNLKPIGRLDYETEGLLLFSNDGDFINHCTHPKFLQKKVYFGEIEGALTNSEKKLLEDGIILEGRKTSKAEINIIGTRQKQTTLKITIHEGRNRQIRKMFALISHPVKYLKRMEIGKVRLGDLKTGVCRNLTKEEINALKQSD